MNYANYLVEDFVLDHCFRDWVLHRQFAHNAFWELWIAEHPEKYKQIREARQVILILHNHKRPSMFYEVESRKAEVCN